MFWKEKQLTLAERIEKRIRSSSDERKKAEGATPASSDALANASATLGFQLPPLLTELYSTVLNGKFGPGIGTGLRPAGGRIGHNPGNTLEFQYKAMLEYEEDEEDWLWPSGLLPLCHWGCEIWSCVDCTTPPYRIVRFDPNLIDEETPWSDCFCQEAESFEQWISQWLDGKDLFQMREET